MSSKIHSRLRMRLTMLVLAALAATLVVLPAVAGSETTPAIEAVNYGGGAYPENHYWSPATATVSAGGTVTLSNHTAVEHGVHWVGGPEAPACSGIPVGATAATKGANWSGTCTFAKAGTYTFYCTVHGAEMTGTITVNSSGTITPGPGSGSPEVPLYPPSGSGGSAPGSGGGGSSGAGGSPFAGGAHALRLATAQHGPSVRGSIDIAPAGAGGRLEVALFAGGASLATIHRPAGVRVGRLVRSSVHAGVLSFTAPLSARARSALRRHRRLALTLQIVLTPPAGAPASVTHSVALRG